MFDVSQAMMGRARVDLTPNVIQSLINKKVVLTLRHLLSSPFVLCQDVHDIPSVGGPNVSPAGVACEGASGQQCHNRATGNILRNDA